MALKLTHKEVIDYFNEASPDVAELVIGIIQDNLEKKEAKRAKISANLKKARMAKNGQAAGQVQSVVGAGLGQTQMGQTGEVIRRRPGRPARVDEAVQVQAE